MKKNTQKKNVLVMGGGIAGATAAARLAAMGVKVTLVEQATELGGHVSRMGCKAAEVCLRCNVCVAVDTFKGVLNHSNIHVLTGACLQNYDSTAGQADVLQAPVYVDWEKCIACDICVKACPQNCLQPAWPVLYQGRPVLHPENCLHLQGEECRRCAEACPTGAISLDATPQKQSVTADAVVVAIGYDPYEPRQDCSWGYGAVTNVISGMEAEQQLAEQQQITRPSDGKIPQRVAFIQCVGSRSEQVHRRPDDTNYCSAVCCAYALRMARRVLHVAPQTEITIFYMDLQNFGKDFDAFLDSLRTRVKFVRARPTAITVGPDDTVMARYEEQGAGQVREAVFDLLVLSIGMRPAAGAESISELLGIAVDQYGFLGQKGASGLAQSFQPGIFPVGACEAPCDIMGSMGQAEAVATRVLEFLQKENN